MENKNKKNTKLDDFSKSEEDFGVSHDDILVGLYKTTLEGEIVFANLALIKMLGFESLAELKQRNLEKYGFPSFASREKFKQLIEKKDQLIGFESAWYKKDGTVIDVKESVKAIKNFNGIVKYYVGAVEDISQQKSAENALKESEEKYRLLAESIQDIIIITDLHGDIIYINNAGIKIGGFSSKAEIIGQNFSKFILEKYRKKIIKNINRRQQGDKRTFKYELEIQKKNGKRFIAEMTSTFFGKAKDPQYILLVARDISIRKKNTEQIKNQNQLLQTLINTIPDPIFYKNVSGKYLGCNTAFENIIGISSQNLVGKSVLDVHPPERAKVYLEQDQSLLKKPEVKTFETTIEYSDGSKREVVYNKATFLDSNGNIAGLVGTIHDITQRKKNETELKKLSLAVEQGLASIIITDIAGNIEYVNRKFTEITGYSKAEVIGKNPRFLQSGNTSPETYTDLWETILSGKVWQGNFENRTKNGVLFWELASISPVRNDMGIITHFIAIKEDVTEKRNLEDQFYQAQKMEAIGKLAGGVAHDFNNLLSVINGYSDLMLRDIDESHMFYNDIKEILNAGKRAAGLTNQLLAFSRKQVLSPELLDLNHVILNLDKMLHRLIGEDIEMTNILADDLRTTKVDRVQFEQIILNLAVNARDAMPAGGKLTIETTNVELSKDISPLKRNIVPGNYVCVTISDTGEGMDKETQSKIFDPFFTTKKRGEGTGLGLATVYGIVKQSNGYILVYSEVGKGTMFKVYFPSTVEKNEVSGKKKSSKQKIQGNEKILVVEDDEKVCEYVKRVLSGYGYSVYDAATGKEAMELVKTNKEINLLLTDVIMPGISGRKLAESIHSIRSDIKVLYMSGYTDNAILHHQVLESGINFITKPFTPLELAKKVREIFHQE